MISEWRKILVEKKLLAIFFVLNLVLTIEANSLREYPLFLTFLNPLLMTPLLAAPVVYGYATRSFTVSVLAYPKWKFAILGLVDVVSWALEIVGTDELGAGAMTTVLSQLLIPISMATSYFWLGERYNILQVESALVVLGGVLIALIPQLQKLISGRLPTSYIGILLFISAQVPIAWTYSFKQGVTHVIEDMPIWYVAFWENLFATIFCIPIMFLPVNSKTPWIDIWNAMKCLARIPEETCGFVWAHVAIFIIVGTLWFVFIIGLIKEGSAALLSLVKALAVPTTTIFFSMKWIMGDNAAPLSYYLLGGGLIICLGLFAFAYGSYRAEEAAKKAQEKLVEVGDFERNVNVVSSSSSLLHSINS